MTTRLPETTFPTLSLMKQLLLIILLLTAARPGSAAVDDSLRLHGRDPLYVQLYGGFNKSANEHLPWSEFTGYPWSGGLFVGLGREITPLWGWRTALRWNHNKSRNVQRCEHADTWSWHSVELFGDATFDLTDALTPRNKRVSRRLNVKAFAGIGGAFAYSYPKHTPLSYDAPYNRSSKLCGALRAGLTATFTLHPHWRVGTEFSHTLFTDRFNGVEQGAAVDMRTNFKVGFTYLFGRSPEKAVALAPVVYDTRLRVVPPLPLAMPMAEEEKIRTVAGRAFLDFPVNETVIHPDYRRNPEELRRIRATIDSALFEPSIEVRHIALHGYASPESPWDNNTRLAKGRTEALKQYLQRHYRMDADLFTTRFTPEDWQNLRDFIATGHRRRVKGDIWYESALILETPEPSTEVLSHRSELLEVIDSSLEPDAKEAELKKVGGGKPYRWLLKHVYPGLRHTDYVIEYKVRRYPIDEARRLIYTHPEALSLEEMYRVALSYAEGADGRTDALLIAARQYPDSEQANLNAACACVRAKRLRDANVYLQKAGASEQAEYVRHVVEAMQGTRSWHMEGSRLCFD